MPLRRTLALAGALSTMMFAACEHPPFAPRWDADMYMPLSTQPIHLNSIFTTGVIPPATAGNVSFPALQQDISGILETVLTNMVTDPARCTSPADPTRSCDKLTLTIHKTTAVTSTDTLFVANAQGNLNAASPGTIVFPISLAVSDVTKTDSLSLTQASVGMLQGAAQSSTPLWVQLRGQVRNPAATPLTIAAADSLGITLSVTVRVAVSH
jgi:hypothetical protein